MRRSFATPWGVRARGRGRRRLQERRARRPSEDGGGSDRFHGAAGGGDGGAFPLRAARASEGSFRGAGSCVAGREARWPEFKARVAAAYQAPSRAIARDLAEGVVRDRERELPSAVRCFMDDFEACIAHPRMPVNHRRATRTTNLLERLFLEERRRRKIIPNAFGEKAALKLMLGAMIRAAERWRAIKVAPFEHRQMDALREELDQEYKAQTGRAKQTSDEAPATKLSSRNRT